MPKNGIKTGKIRGHQISEKHMNCRFNNAEIQKFCHEFVMRPLITATVFESISACLSANAWV